MTTVSFQLPNGSSVPAHYHITEVGHVQKRFIDCGGTTRLEDRICFQLWEAEDFDHRLQAEKLMKIIELSERTLNLPDEEIEVEYTGDTVEIGFNVSYLLDVLSNLKNEKIQISLGDANSSAVITLPGSENFKYVVMPMRI